MSYYKYKERDKSHFVDWGTIGKEMTDMLSLQRKERAAKRDIVEEGQRTQRKELAALPKGVDVNANEQTMALAEQNQTYLLDLHRLLQSGDISYGQYKTAFSNVQTNTEMYLDSATNYNESAAESKRRWDEGESSMLEPWSRAQTEEYNNYSKWTPQIDVATGNMNLLSRSGEGSAMPIVMMAGMTRAQYNKFDVMGSVSTAAQSLEQYIKDARQMGTGLLTIEGLSALKTNSEFIEAENSIINSKLTNPNDVASVLLDSVKFDDDQRQYTPTTSAEEAAKDPSYILMIANPSQPGGSGTSASYGTPGEQYVRDNYPDQADEIIKNIKTQYDEAKDALRDALHLQIPNIETPQSAGTTTGVSEWQFKAGQEADLNQEMASLWLEVSSTATEANNIANINNLLAQQERDVTVTRVTPITTEDKDGNVVSGLRMYFSDDSKQDIPDTEDASQWMKNGATLTGLTGNPTKYIPEGYERSTGQNFISSSIETSIKNWDVPISTSDEKGESITQPANKILSSENITDAQKGSDGAISVLDQLSDEVINTEYITAYTQDQLDKQFGGKLSSPKEGLLRFYVQDYMDKPIYLSAKNQGDYDFADKLRTLVKGIHTKSKQGASYTDDELDDIIKGLGEYSKNNQTFFADAFPIIGSNPRNSTGIPTGTPGAASSIYGGNRRSQATPYAPFPQTSGE